jgi:hypothetical protein
MEIYRSGRWKLTFSPEMVRYLKERQRDFMPEDTKAGMIQAFLDSYPGDTVCSKQLYKEALNHDFDEPKQWETREINEIMNQCATGWNYFSNPRMFAGYGRQKGWEREQPATGREKPRRDSRQCRSRWSFPSEKIRQMTARCTLCCYPRCRPSLSGLFMCASNEPSGYAYISIWRLPRQRQLWRPTAYGE